MAAAMNRGLSLTPCILPTARQKSPKGSEVTMSADSSSAFFGSPFLRCAGSCG